MNRVGKKYRYAGIPRYFFGVVRTVAHLPVPRYSGVSIYSNRKPLISKILTDLKLKQLQADFFQLQTIEFNLKMVCLGVWELIMHAPFCFFCVAIIFYYH